MNANANTIAMEGFVEAPVERTGAGLRLDRTRMVSDTRRPADEGLAPLPTRPPGRSWGWIPKAALAVVLLGALLWGGVRWWDHARTWVSTDNAFVAGHIHTVSSRIAGTVGEVLVVENQYVEAGAVLARLDRRDLEVQRERALAKVSQACAQAAQARAQVAREEALATKARLDFERAGKLFQGNDGAISRQEFDAARAAFEAAAGGLNATGSAVAAADSLVRAAEAELAEVELQLGYTELRAPAAGRVGRRNIEVGHRVQPGQSLLAIVQPEVWVTANFKETQLERLHANQPVVVRLDSFPGREFTGRVESLAPASGGQFALLPPDNATGNFTKVVQRVPVKIVLDRPGVEGLDGRIVPGLSAVVSVHVAR